MNLSLVDYNTAKALKEARYDCPTLKCYYGNNKEPNNVLNEDRDHNSSPLRYSAPTIFEVAQWLREKHRLHVVAFPDHDNNVWAYQICKLFSGFVAQEKFYDRLPDHDTALLAGIQHCLTVLNEKK